MKRRNSHQTPSREREEKFARKRIKSIVEYWADNKKEKEDLFYDCVTIFHSVSSSWLSTKEARYAKVTAFCVDRELEKCLNQGIIEDKTKILAMLADDEGISRAALQMVYVLREKRLDGNGISAR